MGIPHGGMERKTGRIPNPISFTLLSPKEAAAPFSLAPRFQGGLEGGRGELDKELLNPAIGLDHSCCCNGPGDHVLHLMHNTPSCTTTVGCEASSRALFLASRRSGREEELG